VKTRIGVAVIAAALLLYIWLVGVRAVALLGTGEPVAVVMGVAMLVLPAIAVWALARELLFGAGAERLGARLEAEGALPDDPVTVRPSGRVERADGDAVFPKYRAEVEARPDDWRAWYRLGLAYDAAGDRRRAREAIREAIRRERAER
jgi:cytochrome c-type biogenesis protein CcmH/NrfG